MSNEEELVKLEPEVVFVSTPDPKRPKAQPVRTAKYSGRVKAHMKDGSVQIFDTTDDAEAWLHGKPPVKKKKAGQSKPQPPVAPEGGDD